MTFFNIFRRCQIKTKQESGGTWKNWSENIWYDGPPKYIKYPETQADLRAVLADAHSRAIIVRVSGQRHSCPPQIVPDSRTTGICWFPFPCLCKKLTQYVIDMSFYKDISNDNGEDSGLVDMKVLTRDENTGKAIVVVNAGIREDELEYFVTKENLALQTVTAGGIFSIGGMTSNDVHGGSIKYGIFADSCAGFTIMKWDGTLLEVRENDPVRNDGFHPMQFARVNLGLLGVVTRVLVKCDPRPTKQSLEGRMSFVHTTLEKEFVDNYLEFVKHDRLETFYDPYTGGFLGLFWDLTPQYDVVGTPNTPKPPDNTTAERALKNHYGARLNGLIQWSNNPYAFIQRLIQCSCSDIQQRRSPKPAATAVAVTLGNISSIQVRSAFTAYSETWLQEATQCTFLAYFFELPDLGRAGLAKTYRLLQIVADIVTKEGNFHVSGPMEFRFVKAGNSVMAGTYSKDAAAGHKWYVNIEVLVFLASCKCQKNPRNYP